MIHSAHYGLVVHGVLVLCDAAHAPNTMLDCSPKKQKKKFERGPRTQIAMTRRELESKILRRTQLLLLQ
jgi:hypothetical protein